MSSDDKRPEPEAKVEVLGSKDQRTERPEPRPAEEAGDDLESLAAVFSPPSNEALSADSDDDADLGALARVGGQREPGVEDDDTRLDLGHLVSAARQSLPSTSAAASPVAAEPLIALGPPPAALEMQPASLKPALRPRAGWLGPLLVGLGVGLALAGILHRLPLGATATPGDRHAPAAVGDQPQRVEPARPLAVPEQPAADLRPIPAPAATSVGRAPAQTAATHSSERVLTSTSTTPVQASPDHKALLQPLPSTAPVSPPAPPTAQVLSIRPAQAEPIAAQAPADAEKAAAPESNAKPGPSPSVDALLDEALSPSARSATLQRERELALEQNQLPQTPTRDDVTQAMTVLLPAIRGCAMGHSGLATAGIVVRNDGRVAGVEITGVPFAGTASGRCMEGVIRRAHFPRFRQAAFRVRFPLAIQ